MTYDYILLRNAHVTDFHSFLYSISQLIQLMKNKLPALFLKFKKVSFFSFCLSLCCMGTQTGAAPKAAVCQMFTSSHLSPRKLLIPLSLHTNSSLFGARKSTQGRAGGRAKDPSCSLFKKCVGSKPSSSTSS